MTDASNHKPALRGGHYRENETMNGKFSVRHSSDLTRPNSVTVDYFDTVVEADEHARRISHNRYAIVWHDDVGFLGSLGSENLLTMGNRKKLPND